MAGKDSTSSGSSGCSKFLPHPEDFLLRSSREFSSLGASLAGVGAALSRSRNPCRVVFAELSNHWTLDRQSLVRTLYSLMVYVFIYFYLVCFFYILVSSAGDYQGETFHCTCTTLLVTNRGPHLSNLRTVSENHDTSWCLFIPSSLVFSLVCGLHYKLQLQRLLRRHTLLQLIS